MTNIEKLCGSLNECNAKTRAAFWLCLIAAAHNEPPGLDGLTADVIEGVRLAVEEAVE